MPLRSTADPRVPSASRPYTPGMDIDWTRFDAVLFDLDGVLTPTALVHRAAWKEAFDGFLHELSGAEFSQFTEEDYLTHVDGKPRLAGVRDFLASREVSLPEGSDDDPPGHETVVALGSLKNAAFRRLLHESGVDPYPGSVQLLDRLDELDIPWAVVSSSANAGEVLDATGLSNRCPVLVDGKVARDRGLKGKPNPATFLEAARMLDVAPDRCVVVEDAVSGVAAGRNGGFGLVVGVDREGRAEELLEAGADVTVPDLGATI